MDDKDHVFARFKDDKPASADRRETLNIPRRAGAPGSRSVEVVHVRSGGAVRDRPQRQDQYVRAASWDGGFPTRQTPRASMLIEQTAPEAAEPVTHVMPAWEPAATEADVAPAEEPFVAPRRGRGRPRKHPVGQPVAATAETAHAEEPATPRRGRGRPRKSVAAAAGAARAEEPVVVSVDDQGRPRKQPTSARTRRVANPFDASDDGANCMRCGYAIEPAREKRGLMTCSGCG
ncbi:hypothetical protein GCM10011320_55070 [Neoroseomonas lacus]|uniref:Uncharacterized protein n=1 Tax=Neoroseomonas lacus TaxID=287609 RepID=A0A917NY99_9PROT|nr:hypothetical protein GCM10011320_55070 [Neoroseomonas lacus]